MIFSPISMVQRRNRTESRIIAVYGHHWSYCRWQSIDISPHLSCKYTSMALVLCTASVCSLPSTIQSRCVALKVNQAEVASKTWWNPFEWKKLFKKNNFILKPLFGFSLDLSKKKLGEALYCSTIQRRKIHPLIISSQLAIGSEAQSQMNTLVLFLHHERMDEVTLDFNLLAYFTLCDNNKNFMTNNALWKEFFSHFRLQHFTE